MRAAADTAVLRVDGLGKRYSSEGTAALNDVTFEVAEGELLALVGPSGCGKTTLLRIMSGLLAPSEGTVLLDGRAVVRPSGEVALVFQDYGRSLFPWLTVRGNINLALRLAGVPRK